MDKAIKKDWEIVGGMSDVSKMPGLSWSTSAEKCITGSKLRLIKDSVCSSCYALKGNYIFKNVKTAHARRLVALDNEEWSTSMAKIINHYRDKKTDKQDYSVFRWHDSGDLQSVEHLKKIVEVCKNSPQVKHWLPTREVKFVKQYIDSGGVIPDNLCIRVSLPMIDYKKKVTPISGVTLSSVYSKELPEGAQDCIAHLQGNQCKDCRACWNKEVLHISYRKH